MNAGAGDFSGEMSDTTFLYLHLLGSKAGSMTGFFSRFWLSGAGV